MPRSRRLIPSLSLLSAFEAVCRTGSTLAAAHDLDLSQGAVSRLVQSLEQQLGVTLFLREQRRLVPTDAALAYSRDVVKALDLITRGAMRLRANTSGGALSLSVLPAFGTRWLAPRLPRFLVAHPLHQDGTSLEPRILKWNQFCFSDGEAIRQERCAGRCGCIGQAARRTAGEPPRYRRRMLQPLSAFGDGKSR